MATQAGLPQRPERPAIEHMYRNPAPALAGCSLVYSVEVPGGRLLEEWFLGQLTLEAE